MNVLLAPLFLKIQLKFKRTVTFIFDPELTHENAGDVSFLAIVVINIYTWVWSSIICVRGGVSLHVVCLPLWPFTVPDDADRAHQTGEHVWREGSRWSWWLCILSSSLLHRTEQQPESTRAHVCCEQHMSRPDCCWPTRVSVFTSSNPSAGINRLLLNNLDLDLVPRKAAVSWVARSSYFYTFAQQERHHYITWSWTWNMQFSIKVDFKTVRHQHISYSELF